MSIAVGDVFRFYCEFPETSKEKMMVLVKTKPNTFFMINSTANAYVLNEYMMTCQVDIPLVGHEQFLMHDSVASCVDKVDTAKIIRESHIVFNRLANHKVGRISDYIIRNITYVLEEKNRTIPKQLKQEIIAALKEQSE